MIKYSLKYLPILLGLVAVMGCKSKQSIASLPEEELIVLDTLEFIGEKMEEEVEIEKKIYNASATRTYDLVHTRLYLSFDWEKQWVLGKADLTIKPIFYPVKVVELDAKGMKIHGVSSNGLNLKYDYDGMNLSIELEKSISGTESVIISIDYTAMPNSSEGYKGGAITSDKGLFFIDPLNIDPNKPSQIWTQGETENNSRWFPTFDKPNERCTQEIFVTVEDKYSTLSNGKLINSAKNADETRTDYWKQDKPHAPYLFMLAIGEFAWVNDQWKNIPLHYIVEPDYRSSAKSIFNHTPEMLAYFSDLLDYDYPWDKYAQVVTRDYVSGAMENTSAVIFGQFVQKHERELIDNDNDYIVAHEMFHHWFGDLVTCESWANLTLNEGFANYSEYLWAEHKYGSMRADQHRMNELEGYVQSGGYHPLIHYYYDDKEDMFDAHSYNKGGLVLHMLRNLVGDDAFFAALNKYLIDNEYTDVEVDELRIAFEEITGQDLNWFFDQWYLQDGHPILNVRHTYDSADNSLALFIDQMGQHTFALPLEIAVYSNSGKVTFYRDTISSEFDTIKLTGVNDYSTFVLDGKNYQLAIINEQTKTDKEYEAQYKFSSLFFDKYQAFNKIKTDNIKESLIDQALDEDYYTFRVLAIEYLGSVGNFDKRYVEKISTMLFNDAHSTVRAKSMEYLMDSNILESAKEEICSIILTSDEQAYNVLDMALTSLASYNPDEAIVLAEKLSNEKTDLLNESLSYVFSSGKDPKYREWFENKLQKADIFSSLPLYLGLTKFLLNDDSNDITPLVEDLYEIGTSTTSGVYQRYYATFILNNMGQLTKVEGESRLSEEIQNKVNQIKDQEKSEMLRSWYQGF